MRSVAKENDDDDEAAFAAAVSGGAPWKNRIWPGCAPNVNHGEEVGDPLAGDAFKYKH